MSLNKTRTLDDVVKHMHTLSPDLKQEVFDFIDFLRVYRTADTDNKNLQGLSESIPKKRRQAGSLKGEVIFADDFDEPLEDFKDYI